MMQWLFLIRPTHWIKNVFVFTGFVFGSDLNDGELFLKVLLAALAFCFISSAVYIFNDMIDVADDKTHPLKKLRPIASGKVSTSMATIFLSILILSGLFLGLLVSVQVFSILILYFILNLFYTLKLKEIVVLDVFCIAFGFMLRIFAGTLGVGIAPSLWLLICGMTLTLFLGFSKRRAEMVEKHQRKVLNSYSREFLDQLIVITATCAIITYGLYTMSDQTIQMHKTDLLIYTVPFVSYAIFRFLFLLNNGHFGEDPSHELVKDPHMVVTVISWSLLSLFILYTH